MARQHVPGRFHLGVGVGEALNEAHFLNGEWPDWGTRAGMLIEAIKVMRDLWNSEGYVSYDGDHFDYDEVRLYTPPREGIDVHLAGWGPASCRYASRFADHLLTATSPERIEETVVPNFRRGLEEAGRSPDEADVTIEFAAHVGDPDNLVAEIRDCGERIPDETELDNPDPRSVQAIADRRLADAGRHS